MSWPLKSAVVLMVTPVTVTARGNITPAVCAGEPESVTLKVIAVELVRNGVPLINPLEESSVIPAGSLPAVIDHVYGGFPPEACSVTA